LAIGALVGLGFYIRFTWLAGHESLKEAPLEKRDAKALHPDVNKDFNEEKGSFNDYLDEFLLAVRVFGFLEKPVRTLGQENDCL
jgi:lysophospholipid hydrolase